MPQVNEFSWFYLMVVFSFFIVTLILSLMNLYFVVSNSNNFDSKFSFNLI